MNDIIQLFIEETKERRAEVLERNRQKRKLRPKPEKVRKYEYSFDAIERMDQRRYDKQREMEGTVTAKQKEILTDFSNGLTLHLIAMKNRVTMGTVVNHLFNIRNRLDALNNVHAVKIAVQKGLIN